MSYSMLQNHVQCMVLGGKKEENFPLLTKEGSNIRDNIEPQ